MNNRNTELSVGLLGIVGLLAIAGIILQFGKLDGKFKDTYELVVEVSDASGIRKGVPVRLGGIPIGHVSATPNLKPDFSGMQLPLAIFDHVKIPVNSAVTIGTTGLMGDSYVKITLPPRLTGEFVKPDSSLDASEASGLSSIQGDAESLISGMSFTLTEINRTIKNLDRTFEKLDLMTSDENIQTFNETLKNFSESSVKINTASDNLQPLMSSADKSLSDFNTTAENFREFSVRLTPLANIAQSALTEMESTAVEARTTITSFDVDLNSGVAALNSIASTATKAEPGIEQLEGAMHQLQTTLASVDRFSSGLKNSDGLLKELYNNPEFRNDFVNFISKVEKKGFIFYPREREHRRATPPKFSTPQLSSRR